MKINRIILSVIIMLAVGCTQTQVWEKSGGNQKSFNLDSRECEILAEEIALQRSETGKKADPVAFNQIYFECLDAKGWRQKISTVEPQEQKQPSTVQQLAEITGPNSMSGFETVLSVPETFSLAENKLLQVGSTLIQQFFWKGEGSSFINILYQQNRGADFERIPYPVSEPYVQYTSGVGDKALERLQWATFYGNINAEWIMGTGAYYYVSDTERIIIVITRPLTHPEGVAPENVTLTQNQFLQIDQFSNQWTHWLNEQFQQGPGFLKQLNGILRFGI